MNPIHTVRDTDDPNMEATIVMEVSPIRSDCHAYFLPFNAVDYESSCPH